MRRDTLIEMVPSREVSIVIQGPLYLTPKSANHIGIRHSLSALRALFPQSEIVLSTWEGEDVSGLDVDEIVFSTAPESFRDINGTDRHFNKQIVSTQNGIRRASRPYVLKTRADILFKDCSIAQISKQKSKIFHRPITVTNMVFRDPLKLPFLFHPSDVVQFGLKDDLFDFWNIPLEKVDQISTNGRENIFFRYSASIFRCFPEQSLCIRWLNKHGYSIDLKTPTQVRGKDILQWMSVVKTEFNIVDYRKSGIVFPVHFYNSPYGVSSLLTDPQSLKISFASVAKVILNKYLFCTTRPIFLYSVSANIIYFLSPRLHRKIMRHYRNRRPR